MNSFSIHDLNSNERPREKLLAFGIENLSDAELLAIILRSGGSKNSVVYLAQKLLKEFEGLKGLLDVSVEQLLNFKDVGIAKATSIKALCEIALRMNLSVSDQKIIVKKPTDVIDYVKKDLYSQKQEHLVLVSLDAKNGIISKDVVSVGTVTEMLIHPREVFRHALLRNAVSVVLVHNHPSGDPMPSPEDLVLTERVAKAGIVLGIALIDHIIVCNDSFSSVRALDLFDLHKFAGPDDRPWDISKKGGD